MAIRQLDRQIPLRDPIDRLDCIRLSLKNAYDARATNISVEENSELLKIDDDGSGILPKDFYNVALPFFTSKTGRVDPADSTGWSLANASTSCDEIRITTCMKDDLIGTQISIKKLRRSETPCARDVGTTVEFWNMPVSSDVSGLQDARARKEKYKKLFASFALAMPQVNFTFRGCFDWVYRAMNAPHPSHSVCTSPYTVEIFRDPPQSWDNNLCNSISVDGQPIEDSCGAMRTLLEACGIRSFFHLRIRCQQPSADIYEVNNHFSRRDLRFKDQYGLRIALEEFSRHFSGQSSSPHRVHTMPNPQANLVTVARRSPTSALSASHFNVSSGAMLSDRTLERDAQEPPSAVPGTSGLSTVPTGPPHPREPSVSDLETGSRPMLSMRNLRAHRQISILLTSVSDRGSNATSSTSAGDHSSFAPDSTLGSTTTTTSASRRRPASASRPVANTPTDNSQSVAKRRRVKGSRQGRDCGRRGANNRANEEVESEGTDDVPLTTSARIRPVQDLGGQIIRDEPHERCTEVIRQITCEKIITERVRVAARVEELDHALGPLPEVPDRILRDIAQELSIPQGPLYPLSPSSETLAQAAWTKMPVPDPSAACDGLIKKLPQATIQTVCAGKVISTQADALKELIENAVDAGAKDLQVSLFDPSRFRVEDDGVGIGYADLERLCQHHMTSKISGIEDLYDLRTYGFRGQALASLSQHARITVTTRQRESETGFTVQYHRCRMIRDATPCAANIGTIVQVDGLFSESELSKRKGLSCATRSLEEVVKAYTVLLTGTQVTLRSDRGYTRDRQWDTTRSIRDLYGIPRNLCLVPFDFKVPALFEATGCIGDVSGERTKMPFLLFINSRLVDAARIRQRIKQVLRSDLGYESAMICLSLTVKPSRIDVNYKANKSDVGLLDLELIIPALCYKLVDSLALLTANAPPVPSLNYRKYEVCGVPPSQHSLPDFVKAELAKALKTTNPELKRIFQSRPRVNIVCQAAAIAVIRSESSLYFFNYKSLIRQALYQIGLLGWAQLEKHRIIFDPPLDVAGIMKAIGKPNEKGLSALASNCKELNNCLGVRAKASVTYLPCLVRGLPPNLARLPEFLSFVVGSRDTVCETSLIRELVELFDPSYAPPQSRTPEDWKKLKDDKEAFLSFVVDVYSDKQLIITNDIEFAMITPPSNFISYWGVRQ